MEEEKTVVQETERVRMLIEERAYRVCRRLLHTISFFWSPKPSPPSPGTFFFFITLKPRVE